MFKGNILKKFISVALVVVMLFSFMAPAYAQVVAYSSDDLVYLAIGDEMTNGTGLDDPKAESFVYKVAKHLGAEDSYAMIADEKYRIEEIRYLLDSSYAGDGYTEAVFAGELNTTLAQLREDMKNGVANAEYITLNVGINNFATYVIEQMMYYVENLDKADNVKYDYSFENFKLDAADISMEQLQAVKDAVLDRLLAAVPEDVDGKKDSFIKESLEMMDYVAEVASYAYLSYIVSFNAVVREILTINPDVNLYVIGLYNPMQGETVSVSIGARSFDIGGHSVDTSAHNFEVEIGLFFEGLVEMANAYTQVLAPRAYEYNYVHPGNPTLLIDRMADTSKSIAERVPQALRAKLLSAAEDTAVSMVQEMFATYGIVKSYDDAYFIVEEIFYAPDADARKAVIEAQIGDLVVDEVLARIQDELEETSDDTYGQVVVTETQIIKLLDDMEAAGDNETARKKVATDFVVDMMCEAMVGENIAGIYIESKEKAAEAIALLEKNSNAAGGDPAALREAAAIAVMAEIGDDNVLGINKDNVVELLEAMDQNVTPEARAAVVDEWLNDKAAIKIAAKVDDYVPTYTVVDAHGLLDAMDASATDDDAVIAKEHLKAHFTPVLASKIEEKYTEGGFTLQNYASFTEFAVAINNAADEAAVKVLVREEIRKAAAVRIHNELVTNYGLFFGSVTEDAVLALLVEMDSKSTEAEKNAVIENWLATEVFGAPYDADNVIMKFAKDSFVNGYNSYNSAAVTAEELFAGYHTSLTEASSAFANYAELKGDAADTILDMYENQYAGAGETAQKYYTEYLQLRDAAVEKVMKGYSDYLNAFNKGMESCNQMNDKFDTVFNMLCEIAEVETISLNDLMAVAKKALSSPISYVSEMIDNLVQGDPMAKADKTVAYIALRYYLANALMIMPDANGHAVIASQVIKAINGEGTDSLAGGLANRLVDKSIDMYHAAKKYLQLPTNASGQVETLINPDLYVAFGDNITAGDALADGELTYPEILSGYLAMDKNDPDPVNGDILCDYTLDGMRAEELWALVSNGYNGDDYTAGRFGTDTIANLRSEYAENVKNADVITINVGVNNLTTYPLTQTLLALNGEETYEMDWGRYIGSKRYEKINNGKEKVFDLALKLIGKTEDPAVSRVPELQVLYNNCENAMNAAYTLVESMLYAMVGYAANLDNAVEDIAEKNPNAVIVLTGFYDPMEDTYFTTGKTFTVGSREITIPNRTINVEAITDRMLNQANRFLTNYVGAGTSAADEGSRIVTAEISNTELNITADASISKNLSVLDEIATVSVRGHEITIKVPEYVKGIVTRKISTESGYTLHPSANGHKYIANQIINALDFDIYADVIVNDVTVSIGTAMADIESQFGFTMDDESTLYNDLTVDYEIVGYKDEVGAYTIKAKITNTGYTLESETEDGAVYSYVDENGYHEVDVEFGKLIVTGSIAFGEWTMSLDSVVFLNFYPVLTGFGDGFDFANKGGVVIWTGEEAPTVGTQLYVGSPNCEVYGDDEQGMFQNEDGEWYVRTHEIFAKNIGDMVYIRPFVEVAEGVYAYSEKATYYSPAWYCYDVLSVPAERADNRALCAALLTYGAEAQKYFHHNDTTVDDLVTTIPDGPSSKEPDKWVDIDLADYDLEYRESYLDAPKVDDHVRAMAATLTGTRAITGVQPTLDLQGAIRMTVGYNTSIDWSTVTEAKVLFWNEAAMEAATTLAYSAANYSYITDLHPAGENAEVYVGDYRALSDHILAKNLGETVYYAAYVKTSDGNEYCSGLTPYSPEAFVRASLADASLQTHDVCKAIAVYGEMARIRFIVNAN